MYNRGRSVRRRKLVSFLCDMLHCSSTPTSKYSSQSRLKDAQFPRIIASLTRGCVLKIPGTIYMRSTLGPQGKCVLFAGSFLTRGSLNVRLTAVGVPLSVCVVYTNESILSWPPIQMDALLPFAHLLRLTNSFGRRCASRERETHLVQGQELPAMQRNALRTHIATSRPCL